METLHSSAASTRSQHHLARDLMAIHDDMSDDCLKPVLECSFLFAATEGSNQGAIELLNEGKLEVFFSLSIMFVW